MITWGTVIDIILETFDKKQYHLAERIQSPKSSISRIISGQINPSFTADQLYTSILDPKTPTSFAHEADSDNYCLDLLKSTIEKDFKEVRMDMDDHWGEPKYEVFVGVLLKRAKNGASSRKIAQDSIETPTSPKDAKTFHPIRNPKFTNSSKAQPLPLRDTETETAKDLPPSGTVDAFYQSIQNFPIETFIESNPADSLSQSTLWDAISFWGKMDCQQMQENDPDRDTEVYIHIIEFLSELEKYIAFLRKHSISPEAFPDGFQLANCDCEELDGEINCYQQRLKSLYQIAVSETETEISNRLKEQQKAQKKAGIYEHLSKN